MWPLFLTCMFYPSIFCSSYISFVYRTFCLQIWKVPSLLWTADRVIFMFDSSPKFYFCISFNDSAQYIFAIIWMVQNIFFFVFGQIIFCSISSKVQLHITWWWRQMDGWGKAYLRLFQDFFVVQSPRKTVVITFQKHTFLQFWLPWLG